MGKISFVLVLCSGLTLVSGLNYDRSNQGEFKLVGLQPTWDKLVTHLGLFQPISTQSLSTYTTVYDVNHFQESSYQILPTYSNSYYKPMYSTIAYQVIGTGNTLK